MITISHIFPIESPYCQFSGKSESPVNSLITKFTEYCVLKCPNSVTVRNLLFQCAVSHATKESDVTYICRQPLDTLPLGVHGMPRPEADVLKSVKFLYLKTVDEVVEFCASIHNKVVGPDLIVVDDIDGYIEQFKAVLNSWGGNQRKVQQEKPPPGPGILKMNTLKKRAQSSDNDPAAPPKKGKAMAAAGFRLIEIINE
uniref:Uncharacterized protein n=1 Tax=Magallana gigas TaxID=29159 RepID=K1Q7U0_MAGGI